MQMNHCIVEVFTFGVGWIINQKAVTNNAANMSLVETVIKEVITDRHGTKSKHFVDFVVKATTLHQHLDLVLILHVVPGT